MSYVLLYQGQVGVCFSSKSMKETVDVTHELKYIYWKSLMMLKCNCGAFDDIILLFRVSTVMISRPSPVLMEE